MKYIKLYEQHNQYYIKIGIDEYRSKLFGKRVQWEELDMNSVLEFTDRDLKYIEDVYNSFSDFEYPNFIRKTIKSFFGDFVEQAFDEPKLKLRDDVISIELLFGFIYKIKERDKEIYSIDIYKTIDEWYYVSVYISQASGKRILGGQLSLSYKCDQLEGIKKLLEDINNETLKDI